MLDWLATHVSAADLGTVGLLILIEGVLSIDNALALAVLARPLRADLRKKALTYGLAGAIFFRFVGIASAQYLMHWTWVKYVGGGYLLWLAFSHYFRRPPKGETEAALEAGEAASGPAQSPWMFWRIVIAIELTDIAFAVDSILAAVALSNKLWVVVTGGILGTIAMRYAAMVFIKLLQRYPRFEDAAFLLVGLIGAKVTLEAIEIEGVNFHSPSNPAFWVFWSGMLLGLGTGFLPEKRKPNL
jgi:YkoY family integral membrane protein